MIDPLAALFAAGVVAAATGVLLWPDRGLVWRWQRTRHMTQRVLVEDALKHLCGCEYQRQAVTVQSLSGALGVAPERAAHLLARMEATGLLTRDGEGRLSLTPEGRNYALRIIRVHRLWERYLAEQTGVAEAAWHHEAELHEHAMSPAEVDALAARMGHPVYDPHGDPIPTAAGDLPPKQGRPLAALPAGELAAIVHVEDEPEAIYAQLVAEGLHPGMRVQVTEITPERIRFWADGDEHVLAPVIAEHVTVVPLPAEQEMEGPFEPLTSLEPGEKGKILSISRACRGLERRRLMDLGILPGTVVVAEMRSPAGDPTAYRVRGSLIALRRGQADLIHIKRYTEVA